MGLLTVFAVCVPGFCFSAKINFSLHILGIFFSQKVNDQESRPVAYVASTIRNKDTYDKFLVALGKNFLNVMVVPQQAVVVFSSSCFEKITLFIQAVKFLNNKVLSYFSNNYGSFLDKFGIERKQILSVPEEFICYEKTSEIVLHRLQLS